jgi:hypothetical protein
MNQLQTPVTLGAGACQNESTRRSADLLRGYVVLARHFDEAARLRRVGAVKLNKIAYYADMESFASTGDSITNATYMKQRRGPVPKEVVEVIENLKKAGRRPPLKSLSNTSLERLISLP